MDRNPCPQSIGIPVRNRRNPQVTTCVTSDGWTFSSSETSVSEWRQLAADEKLVSAAVRGTYSPSRELDSTFPTSSSYDLYRAFFGDVETCLRGKTHILLATDPDFFSIPWNALLTKPFDENRPYRHRDASWFAKSYSLSLLPSVRSLFQLRGVLRTSRAKQKFLGVGDPDFKGTREQSTEVALRPLFISRGIANREAIANLPKLPDTVDELNNVAKALDSSNGELLLGRDATERKLRSKALRDYRVISFATHAIVAGQIEGVTEPALVLSPGSDDKNESNDGLLTATEIANLELDANLVILSSCNTAAPDGRLSGRGLSGLADSFFFAGAHALVVTQWSVISTAAKQLAGGLISFSMASHLGVAEGLRESVLDYISTRKEDYLAHPRFWAAFVIAGDGAVKPLDQAAGSDDNREGVVIDWEHVAHDLGDGEILNLAKVSGTFFAMGIQKPGPSGNRAGRYLSRITMNNIAEVVSREPDIGAWPGVVSLGKSVGVLGYRPADTKSVAIFRLQTGDGQVRWQFVVDSSLWNFPLGMVESADNYILISIETDYSTQPRSI